MQCQLLLGKRTQRHGQFVGVNTGCRKSLYGTQTVRVQVHGTAVAICTMQSTKDGHAAGDTAGLLLAVKHVDGCNPCTIVQLC